MEELTTYKMSDICHTITDGDHMPPPKVKQGVPFITIGDIDTFNAINFNNHSFTTQEYYENLNSSRKAQTDDILYTVVGSFGIPVLVRENKAFIFQRHIALLRPNKDLVYPPYLYYLMKNRDFYNVVDILAIGCAQRTLSLSSLRNIEVKIPSINKQKQIANVLSSLDSKIELNRRINDNLISTYYA